MPQVHLMTQQQIQSVLSRSSYKPATGGHAPGDLRDAFLEAIEPYGGWEPQKPEPTIEVRDQPMLLSKLCGLLWNCTDTMPGSAARYVGELVHYRFGEEPRAFGSYAACARALKAALARSAV